LKISRSTPKRFNRGNTWNTVWCGTFLIAGWSACLFLSFCKLLPGVSRFAVGALHALVNLWLRAHKRSFRWHSHPYADVWKRILRQQPVLDCVRLLPGCLNGRAISYISVMCPYSYISTSFQNRTVSQAALLTKFLLSEYDFQRKREFLFWRKLLVFLFLFFANTECGVTVNNFTVETYMIKKSYKKCRWIFRSHVLIVSVIFRKNVYQTFVASTVFSWFCETMWSGEVKGSLPLRLLIRSLNTENERH
jgi:hypothetical protein